MREAKAGKTGATRPTIGWREWIALPEFEIANIKAKIDTGARSSALHAYDVEPFTRRGARYVRFKVHPYQRDTRFTRRAEAPLIDMRPVKNSGGTSELRPVVETLLHLGDTAFTIELTLTNRDEMGFRMLLGRQAVRGRFVIDPGRSFLVGKPAGRRHR